MPDFNGCGETLWGPGKLIGLVSKIASFEAVGPELASLKHASWNSPGCVNVRNKNVKAHASNLKYEINLLSALQQVPIRSAPTL